MKYIQACLSFTLILIFLLGCHISFLYETVEVSLLFKEGVYVRVILLIVIIYYNAT